MDPHRFYDLVRDKQFDEAHRYLDDELMQASDEEKKWIHHRRTSVYLGERRHQHAIDHLLQHRGNCGTITSTHDLLAMIYEVIGRDDLALQELRTAPYDADDSADPLLISDAKFYWIYFRARRKMPVSPSEIDAFPDDYETFLPANGLIRGILVKKKDVSDLIEMMP